ncbi:glucose-1-phosphate cytidylyltransferase [Rhodopila sp.]|uniref:glucose-1-phosphate cytidylyltransferase n=1 Tax=Rhodopila sp. TaxID=2480087 RepID=UPI002C521A44|nr:glucose-1-phosphate cytidylyltransferase [Rhodopila sp.]HVZ10669.1 glucose-1-phosphate cytidylyltransferase [Rhodopila sp.]
MKAVLLAGGLGTRFAEETDVKPKPMIEIGGKPIIWHIMKIYSSHGINDFIVCLGYKGYVIKEYFRNYFLHMSNVTFDIKNNLMEVHQDQAEPWKVTLVDTGESTMIGGRIKRILPYINGDTEFCLTYGDGVGNVDIAAVIDLHRSEGRLATVTAVQPPGRFGAINFDGNRVTDFQEKPIGDGGWINGGFFVLSPEVGRYIAGDATVWEQEPMRALAAEGNLSVYFHRGFWQPMDTLRDKRQLEELWATGKAPWKLW